MHRFLQAYPLRFLFIACMVNFLVFGCGGIEPINPNTITDGYVGESQKQKAIIFIHGLFGHTQHTWQNERTRAYWPNLLRNDPQFQDYAIFLIGYSSPKLAKASTIEEIATRELQKLKDEGVFDRHQQIYFLTHSMGGLIAKRMLVKLHHPNTEDLKMLDKIRAVVFLSTPSQGSEMAKIVSKFSPNPQPNDLQSATHNSFLQSLENEWQNLLLDRSKGITYPKSFCAYETKSTSGVMIVNRVSAITICDNNPYAMDLNHIEIAKPASENVDPYKWVKARILEVASTNGKSRIDILMKELHTTPIAMALRAEDKNKPVIVEGRMALKGGAGGPRNLQGDDYIIEDAEPILNDHFDDALPVIRNSQMERSTPPSPSGPDLESIMTEGRMTAKADHLEFERISPRSDEDTPITSLVFNIGRWRFAVPAIKAYLMELSLNHKLKFAIFLEEDNYRGWMPANKFLSLFFDDPEGITRHLNTRHLFQNFSNQLYKGQVNSNVSALKVKEKLEQTEEPGIAIVDDFGTLIGIASREGIDSQILGHIISTKNTN